MAYDAVRESMSRRISGGRLFQSYIVSGSDAAGRETAARYIAKTAVCSAADGAPCSRCRDCEKADRGVHPDITFVEREKDESELKVDAVRRLREAAAVMPNEAERSVYIIREADLMNQQAQNALLKTLEEPPRRAVFVLLAENPEKLLPTVRSRCEELRLPPEGEEHAADAAAEAIADAAERYDDLALLRLLMPLEKADREEMAELLDSVRRCASARLRRGGAKDGRLEALAEAAGTAEKYLDANVSPGHAAGYVLAAMAGGKGAEAH